MDNRLFIDTWGWLTLHNRGETYHQETVEFYQNFLRQRGKFYTTDYVLDETFTLFFRRLNSYQAQASMELLLKSFEHNNFQKIWITPERFEQTLKLRVKYLDKPLISFTDLSSMVVMKELGINQILTDDDHFQQVGMGLLLVPPR